MTAKEVLETALEVVGGERASTHGSMLENHRNIAQLWNAYLFNKDELEASDVANMMELMKVARRKLGTLNRDDYVDGAGYAAVAYQCAEAGEDFTMTLDFGRDYDAINNVVFGPVKP
jgi:hypothetical protein|tara:strand:- start:69 stop:419 length:351 start_codon:yes stop_codon:yes gene_type:complete